jgi:hypothetical protein
MKEIRNGTAQQNNCVHLASELSKNTPQILLSPSFDGGRIEEGVLGSSPIVISHSTHLNRPIEDKDAYSWC